MTEQLENASAPRPVALAIRSMLVLGFVCTLFGLTFVIAFGLFNTFERFRPWFIAMGLTLWLGPGVSFLWCGLSMRRRASSNAAAVAFGTTVFQAIGVAALLVAAATFEPVTILPIALCLMWLAALIDCMRHLVRARRFLASATEQVRGFDVLMK